VPIALGMMKEDTIATCAVLWLRDLSLSCSRLNVAPIAAMADLLRRRGIPEDRIATIHHWSDGETIRPLQPGTSRLRREWGLEDKFVVGYSGNLGRAHDFTTILDAMQRLAHREDVVFLFVGDGHRKVWVEQEVARRGLRNVIMKPLQPRELLAESLAVADVHLVSLLPTMEAYIVPSKFYGIAAAGRATLFVGDLSGEIARLVRQGDCGAVARIGDSEGLAALIEGLAQAPEECARLGANARRMFDADFSEARGVSDWVRLIAAVAPDGVSDAVGGPAALDTTPNITPGQ